MQNNQLHASISPPEKFLSTISAKKIAQIIC